MMSNQHYLNGYSEEAGENEEESVNVTDRCWITRKNRDAVVVDRTQVGSGLDILKQQLLSDVCFAFGDYKYGKLRGPPVSFFSEASKSSVVKEYLSSLKSGSEEAKKANKVLTKLAGHPSMVTIRLLGWMLGKLWSMVFTSIEVEGLKETIQLIENAKSSKKAVVFLPTHRSHVDYLLMSYVCFGANLPMPSIVAGDNLNMFLIGKFLSYGGAFFIRRKNNDDPLYKTVLKKYVQDILLSGKVLELFVEGGRTRTGFISKPKMGLMNCVASVLQEEKVKNEVEDVLLVPIAIDYENVVENIDAKGQGGYAANLLGAKKNPESFTGTIRLMFRLLSGGNSSHGKAFVKFGKALSLKRELKNRTNKQSLSEVGKNIVKAQRDVSKVTSIAILAFVLLNLTTTDLELAKQQAKNMSNSFSPQELMNLLFCFRTNQFKKVMVNTVVVPRFVTIAKLLVAYEKSKLSEFYFVRSLKTLAEHDFDIDLAEELVWQGLSILESFFQKRLESGVTYAKWFMRLFNGPEKEHDTSRESIESDAKFRLNLNYCYGQLSIILLPFSMAAVSFITKTSTTDSLQQLSKTLGHYYAGEIVTEAQILESKKVLLKLLTNGCRKEFDNCCAMFVGHIQPGLQVIENMTNVEEANSVDAVQKDCFKIIRDDRKVSGINIRPEILNKQLIKKLLESEAVIRSGSLYEIVEKLSKFMVIKQRRVLSSKEVAYIFRDLNYLSNKRLRKVIAFLAFVWFLKWAFKH